MKAKNLKEQEVRTPNQDKNPRSDSFNRELFRFLESSNWTNPETQKRLVALINSVVLTGGKNKQSQSLIIDYLERGLDILDIEIQNMEVDRSQKSVVQVDPEEVDDTQQVQESINKNRKILKKIKENLDKLKNNRELLQETKLFIEACKKRQVSEEAKDNKEGEELNKEDQVDQEGEQEVYLNNYRTFMNNFLGHDLQWSDEFSTTITQLIENIIKNLGKDSRKQSVINIEIRNLSQALQRTLGTTDRERTSNANSAIDELSKYAQTYGGWGAESVNVLLNNLFSMILNVKNKSHIRVLLRKISDIYNQME